MPKVTKARTAAGRTRRIISSFPRYRQIRDRLVLLPWAVLESIGYRQLTVFWRLRGLVKFVRGRKDWGVMTRTGFAVQTEPSENRVP